MARPKAFSEEAVLDKAMHAFWWTGYEGTPLDSLLSQMGIGRQSLYDTFGGKHALFLRVLRRYQEVHRAPLLARLDAEASPKAALREVFLAIAEEKPELKRRGCLMVNATTELAERDPEVAKLVAEDQQQLEAGFRRCLERAREVGEVSGEVKPGATARFLVAAMLGLRVAAQAEPSPARLRDMAKVSLSVLD